MQQLIEIMAKLRDPKDGCPWDLKQTFKSIAPHSIEEAYEVADALERGNMEHFKEELGDLLFQVVFQARMAEELGLFNFDDIVQGIAEKLIAGHPHIFANGKEIKTAEEQTKQWNEWKVKRKAASGQTSDSILDDISQGLPPLKRAEKIQKRVAKVGFDWPDALFTLDKVNEEVQEIREELEAETINHEAIEEEVSDLFFACVCAARHTKVDPEMAMIKGTVKFEKRFKAMEKLIKETGKDIEKCTSEEFKNFWKEAKKVEFNERQAG